MKGLYSDCHYSHCHFTDQAVWAYSHIFRILCALSVVCWLEVAGGEATAAVGDWEATRCCVGVGGVCSSGD